MNVIPSLYRRFLYAVLTLGSALAVVIAPVAYSAPTVADDSFNVVEDQPFTAAAGPLFENDFDGEGVGAFDGDWDYLDRLENQNGAGHGYPVDGASRAWNEVDFDEASSTVAGWTSGAAPMAAGGIQALPSPATTLFGIDEVDGTDNLITTYLFRNTFTLTAAEAVIADWNFSHVFDDAAIVYVNGAEVFRTSNMPVGVPTTQTFADGSIPNETAYTTTAADLGAHLVTGVNVIAVELHQARIDSSDVGFDVILSPAAELAYVDDPFPSPFDSSAPNFANGSVEANGGFGGSGGLGVLVGFRAREPAAGAWRVPVDLAAPATLAVSFRYRLVQNGGYESSELSYALFAVDGDFYGEGGQDYLAAFQGDGNDGPDMDTGWRIAEFDVPLSAGAHNLDFGTYNNHSTIASEITNIYFDDISVGFASGGEGGGVLENDSGGGGLAAALATPPAHGSVTLNSDGTFVYTPDDDFFGADSFTYTATDSSGTSAPATVSLVVAPVNDRPTADPRSLTVVEDGMLSLPQVFGLALDSDDVDGDSLTHTVVNDVSNGSLTLNADGSLDYSPDGDFYGEDSFTYRASDASEQSDPATVTITVAPDNDPPVAVDDSYSTPENFPLVVDLSGAPQPMVVLSDDFSSSAAPEITGVTNLESSGAFAGLGGGEGGVFAGAFLRNRTSGDPADSTTITIGGLPPHDSISIGFLLAVIDSWDGAGDELNVVVDGQLVFSESFENSGAGAQSYSPPTGGELARKVDLGFGSGGAFVDSAYDMSLEPALQNLPHTAATVTIEIFVDGSDWDGGDDESWAIDNLVVSVLDSSADQLVAAGSVWRYLDDGSDQGTSWRAPAFGDGGWASGPAELGYGDGGESTVVGFGPDENDKYPTTYFRHAFDVVDPGIYESALVGVQFDDGVAVYLNGTEIVRENLGAAAAYDAYAIGNAPSETAFSQFAVDPALLVAGENVLAVEVHQILGTSSDISFDLWMRGQQRLNFGVIENDSDIDSASLTATVLTQPSGGSVAINPDGSFTYTPNLNFQGADQFTYTLSDGEFTDSGVVDITVIPGPNDLPDTVADSYGAMEDVPLVVSAAFGVLDNDSDPEGEALTALVAAAPANGTLVLASDGSFTYTSAQDFNGADSFTYRASDGLDNSAPTLVNISVSASNDPPTADEDSYLAAPGTVLNIAAPGVLDGDSDVDGDSLSAELFGAASVGNVVLASDGGFAYTPPGGFSGRATFIYRASDTVFRSALTTVTIDVNGAPTANALPFTLSEDTTLAPTANLGVLSNDTDPEIDALSAELVDAPAHGSLSLAADGSFSYTPEKDYNGSDSFTYIAKDQFQSSSAATVTLTVNPVDDPPMADDDEYVVLVQQSVVVLEADGVLQNDSDAEGDALSAVIDTDVSSGSLTLNGDGSFTYTPDVDFSGVDSFTYTATGGGKSSSPATVTLLVGAAADSVLINEMMFHPASEDDGEEFIELLNIGSTAVPLEGWRFTSGLSFDFPAVTIPPGGYVVIAADPATFAATYGAGALVVGPWTGRLSNSGERVRIEDNIGREVDDISYSDQGDWARRRAEDDASVLDGEEGWKWDNAADGGGSSLELVNLDTGNQYGQNWAPSAGVPTPGADNSTAAADVAPLLSKVKHHPGIPKSSEDVIVSAKLRGAEGETLSATLHWRVSIMTPGAFTSTAMFDDGAHGDGDPDDGLFAGTVPAQSDGTVIEFYVEGSDGGLSRTWPAASDGGGGQGANALFQFDDEDYTGNQPIYRLIMTAEEDDEFRFANFTSSSDAQKNATLVARQGSDIDIRYQCGVRVRGAGSRSRNPRNNRLNIPRDVPWNGVSKINLNTQFVYLQLIGSKLASASGIEGANAKPVQLRHNSVNRANDAQTNRRYGSYLHIEPIDGDWAERHYPENSGGNTYSKGRPDVKWTVRTSGGVANGVGYRGDGWGKTSNESADDWSDLHNLFITMNGASTPNYLDQVDEVIDHDQWARWFAFMTIVLSRETNLSNGTDDDYKFYRGLADPRFKLVPHDFDTIFGLGDTGANPTDSLFPAITNFAGQTFPQLVPFFDDPTIARLHYAHMKEMLETVFAKPEFDAMIENCIDWVPQSVRDDIINFMDARRDYILAQIPSNFSATSSLASVGGVPQADEAEVTGLGGTIDAARTAAVRVNGIDVAIDPNNGTWSGASVNSDTLLPAGATWRYLDDGSNLGSAWRASGYDDGAWETGVAELGYGGRGEATVVDFGTDPNNKHVTTYFRTTFEVADPSVYGSATLRLVFDDSVAVYVNGTEVRRVNLDADAAFDALATDLVVNAAFIGYDLPTGVLQAGTNTIAIEIHQRSVSSIDISMDAEILASQPPLALSPGLNSVRVEAIGADGEVIDSSDVTIWFDDGSSSAVSGTIAADTTWATAAGPYVVSADIVVPPGVTLTIEPGTSVFFADDTRMTVRGRLLAEGTADSRINFSQEPGTTGGWDGVYFENSLSDNRMSYVDQDGSDSGSHSTEVTGSRLVLDHVRWSGTTETVLEISAPQLDVIGCDFPPSSGQEAIHGASLGGSDYFNLIGNLFRTSSGYNDIIDFSGGRRPGSIIYVIGNTFTGGTDDCLDFDGIDAHIEGNVFMNIHTDDPGRESSSNAIATDGSAHITVVRNLFYDVDHALLLKNNSDAVFENNTVVGATIAAINFDETNRSGVVPGDGITMRGNVFYNNAATFQNQFATGGEDDPVIVAALNVLPAAHHFLGSGNIDVDPLFADAAAGDFSLIPGSPAIGAGINGADMGYDVSAGATVSGEPAAFTRQTGATLTVHMPGISGIESGSFTSEYRWRLDAGAWSAPVNVLTPITLSGLADGAHQVEVIGKDSAGVWQDEALATASRSWTVDSSSSRLVISEFLANNDGVFDHEGSFPDFIEIWNDSASSRDVSGMVLADIDARVLGWSFPAASVIPADGRLVVFAAAPDGTGGLHTGFGLDDDGEGVFLFDTAANGGGLLDSVEFGFQLAGVSLSRTGQTADFAPTVPTPGQANAKALPLGSPSMLSINEWLATNGIVYDNDFLELYNPTSLPVALAGLSLSDDPNNYPQAHVVAPLSYIGAGGFVKFIADSDGDQGPSHLNFSLSKLIDSVGLFDTDGTEIDRVLFNNGIDDTSEGRVTDGSQLFADFVLPTPGFSNGTDLSAEALVLQSLRIVEIMFNPSGAGAGEYVKLQNVGPSAIGLGDVQFDEGISFDFPDLTLAPGEVVYVVRDSAAFAASFGAANTVLGEFAGKLDNGGERLRLEIASLAAGILDFSYDDDWYPTTDGGGASLGIIDPDGTAASWSEKDSWQALGGDGPSFAEWVIAEFGGPSADVTGKGDDPDLDGIVNLLEFVFGLDPNSAEPNSALPQVSVEGGFLTLTYTTTHLPGEVIITPQVSGGLAGWADAGAAVAVQLLTDDGTLRTYKATDSQPISSGGERFLRLWVECP